MKKSSSGAARYYCRGMSRRSNTFERDEASAVTKVHIRNAAMGWRVNEYVLTTQEFQQLRSDGDVPVENACPPGETDLREFHPAVQ
jgi:hypothetical protein